MAAQRIHAGSDFNVLIPLESIAEGMTHADYTDVRAYLVDKHGGLRAQFSKVAATGFNQWIQEADRGTVLNIVIPLDDTITRFLERGTYSLKVAFYFTDSFLPDNERIQSDSQEVITIVDDDEPTDELSEMVFYYAILNNGGNAIQIQGIDVSEVAPADGQILVYNEETDELEYADPATNVFNTIEFNTSYSPTGSEPIGAEYWDADNHTKTTVLEFGVKLQNGFELLKLANDEGNDFFEGAAVSVKGATGNRVAIEITNFSSSSTNVNKFIGLVTSAPDSGNRIILRYGDINGINTIGGLSYGGLETWIEGDEIWGDVSHPGYMTNVEPTGASNYKVFIGTITVASATVGQISTNFRIYQNGTEIVSLIDTLYGTTWRSARTAATTSFTPYEDISATELQTAIQQVYDLIPSETTITTLTEDVAIAKATTQTYAEVFAAANLPLLWGGYDVHVYHAPGTHNVGDLIDTIETLGYFGGRLIMHNALDGEGQSTDLTERGTNQPATINFNGTGNFKFVNLGVQVIFDSLKLTTDADNNNQLIYALGGLNGSSHFCYWDFDAGTLADSACVFGDAQWTFDNDVFRESSTVAAQNSCAIEMSGGIGVGRNGHATFINCTTTGSRPFLTGAKGVGEASFKDSDTAFTNQAGSESTDNVIVLTDQAGTAVTEFYLDEVSTDNITADSVDVLARFTDVGTIYIGIYTNGSTPPTVSAPFTGFSGTGFLVGSSISVTSGNVDTILSSTINTVIEAGTDYDVYVIAVDSLGRNFSAMRLTEFTTLSAELLPVASNVAFTGTETVGQQLSGSYDITLYGATETDTTFQWYRADDGSGTNEAAISGATAINYTLATADTGKYLRLGVTPVSTNGTGDEAFSSYSGAISAVNMISNGTFDSATGWTLTGFTITDGKLTSDGGGYYIASQALASMVSGFEINSTYRCYVDIVATTTLAFRFRDTGNAITYKDTVTLSTGNDQTFDFTTGSSVGANGLRLALTDTKVGTIDNLRIYKIS